MSGPPSLLFAGLLAACVAGCGVDRAALAAGEADPSARAEPPSLREKNMDPGLRTLADIAVQDLARRLGTDRAAISVIEARAVVWPDRSLGCPQPGVEYLQVQQDGALIRLRSGGREYAYHSGGGRPPFLCEPRK